MQLVKGLRTEKLADITKDVKRRAEGRQPAFARGAGRALPAWDVSGSSRLRYAVRPMTAPAPFADYFVLIAS